MNARVPIAADRGLIGCDVCALVLRARNPGLGGCCPRCGNTLHARKPFSVYRTWVWLVLSLALYVPARPRFCTR